MVKTTMSSYVDEQKRIERALQSFFNSEKRKYGGEGKLGQQLFNEIYEASMARENRLGGMLVLLGYEEYCKRKNRTESVIAGALSFEVFQTFEQICREMVDLECYDEKCTWERVRRTLPRRIQLFRKMKVATSLAIVLSDMALSIAYQLLDEADAKAENIVRASRHLGGLTQTVNFRKFFEIDGKARKRYKRSDIIHREHNMKDFLAVPLQIGAFLAGANNSDVSYIGDKILFVDSCFRREEEKISKEKAAELIQLIKFHLFS